MQQTCIVNCSIRQALLPVRVFVSVIIETHILNSFSVPGWKKYVEAAEAKTGSKGLTMRFSDEHVRIHLPP